MQKNNLGKSIPILRIFLISIYLIHWGAIWQYAIDVPHYDEWQELLPGQNIFTFAWFFKQHNEHWIITTKILNWINYQLFAWNFAYQQIFNFALYGCLLAVYYSTLLKLQFRETIFAPFFIFLLSDVAWENHSWAFQSQFHLYLLFHLLAVRFLSRSAALTFCDAGWAAFFSLLSIISFSAALPASLLLALVLLINLRAQSEHSLKISAAFYAAAICAACGMWLAFYSAPPEALSWNGPWKLEYWKHLLTQLALGVGFDSMPQLSWIAGLILVVAAFFLEYFSGIFRRCLKVGGSSSKQEFFLVLFILSILASLAGVALGRSVLAAAQAQASRYAEISGLLLPALAVWSAQLTKTPARWALLAIWACAFFGHFDNWNFISRYSAIANSRKSSLNCALKTEEQVCPSAWPLPLRAAVEHAKELELSFTQ